MAVGILRSGVSGVIRLFEPYIVAAISALESAAVSWPIATDSGDVPRLVVSISERVKRNPLNSIVRIVLSITNPYTGLLNDPQVAFQWPGLQERNELRD
jgi:hypothetical protein